MARRPTAVEAAKKYFLHNLEAMTARVESGGPYLFGDRLSTADILLMTCLDWAVSIEIALPETVLALSPASSRNALPIRRLSGRNFAS